MAARQGERLADGDGPGVGESVEQSKRDGQDSIAAHLRPSTTIYGADLEQHLSRRRKLPPFGRDLVDRLTHGNLPSNGAWIYTGPRAWQAAEASHRFSESRAALILPDGDDATRYRWPVRGIDCMVISTGCSSLHLEVLGRELIQAGASMAYVMWTADNERGIFDVTHVNCPAGAFLSRSFRPGSIQGRAA